MGNLYYHDLLSGIQSVVVKSSVGLHSAHKPGDQITEVNDDDYDIPLGHFEKALEFLDQLKRMTIWLSTSPKKHLVRWRTCITSGRRTLLTKRVKSPITVVKRRCEAGLTLFKKALDIDPNHAQAGLMITYAKKMLAIGWTIYDEYGFEAKQIEGEG